MSRINSKPVRVVPEFDKRLRDLTRIRFNNGLIKFNQKELGLARATQRLLRCPSWSKVESEYLSLPERENGKKK